MGRARGLGRPGHAVEGRALRGLDQDQAPGPGYGLRAPGPVRARARKDHGAGPLALLRGQVQEEAVDGQGQAPFRALGAQPQAAVLQARDHARRQDEHAVGLRRVPVPHQAHGQGRVAGEDLGQGAVALRVQVLEHQEAQPGVRGQMGEEQAQGLQASGRGAQGHDPRPRGRIGRGLG